MRLPCGIACREQLVEQPALAAATPRTEVLFRPLVIGLLDAALGSSRLVADRKTRKRALAPVAQVGDSVRSDLL
jgi:hypothetical protein